MKALTAIASKRNLIHLMLLALGSLSSVAGAQTKLAPLGGAGGGNFEQPCSVDRNLIGFELRTGDDVDAIRPICALAYAPNLGGGYEATVPWGDPSWHGGPGGGQQNQVVCPPDKPAVLGLTVYAEGQDTIVVNTISLFCGLATRSVQLLPEVASAVFDAPHYVSSHFFDASTDSERCPAGEVAVGMLGRSGKWLDSMGLICGAPRLSVRPGSPVPATSSGPTPQRTVVGSIGRVQVPGANPPICARARAARARNSGAAAILEQQCREAGGDPGRGSDPAASGAPPAAAPPPPDGDTLNGLQQRGRVLAQADPLLQQIYQNEPDGPNRLGFETGLASNENDTGQGPNKERFKNQLPSGLSKAAFQRAIDYTVDRNANQAVFLQGQAVVAANPTVMAARQALPLGNQWLGFTIGAGLFGNPADGGMGRTERGPNSNHLREMLSPASRMGYDAALAYLRIP